MAQKQVQSTVVSSARCRCGQVFTHCCIAQSTSGPKDQKRMLLDTFTPTDSAWPSLRTPTPPTTAARSRPARAARSRGAQWAAGAGGWAVCKRIFLYLEQRAADLLVAVKHCRRKGFQIIRDRLNYGRKAVFENTHRERKRGRDLAWTLRGMNAPEWVAENRLGNVTILAVR